MSDSIVFKQIGFSPGRRRVYKVFNLVKKQEFLVGNTFNWEVPATMALRSRHCSVDEDGNQVICHDDHNQLRSLQGGIDAEYYHLSFAQFEIVRDLQPNEFEPESGVGELDAVYLKSNGRIDKATSGLTLKEARTIGIVRGGSCFLKLYRPGEVVENLNDIGVILLPGNLVFLDVVPGRYTTDTPSSGQYRVPIGVALSSNSFWFWPNIDNIEQVS